MNTNVNLAAPVGVLVLLGTGFVLLVALIFLIQSLIVRKRRRAKLVLVVVIAICALYLAGILAFSFAGKEKVLARGEEKHFCEVDCHLAYSIINVRRANALDEPPGQTNAQGKFTIVTIKTRFDEKTISAGRGNGPLYPNSRVVTLIDESGNRYGAASQRGTALPTPLRPAESYTTEIVFNVPAEAKPSALLINEGEWITHFVIGHENSPLHKKTRFQL